MPDADNANLSNIKMVRRVRNRTVVGVGKEF